MKKLSATYVLILMFALPLVAFAEGEAYNPPGAIGAALFFIALILPIMTGIWIRNGRQ